MSPTPSSEKDRPKSHQEIAEFPTDKRSEAVSAPQPDERLEELPVLAEAPQPVIFFRPRRRPLKKRLMSILLLWAFGVIPIGFLFYTLVLAPRVGPLPIPELDQSNDCNASVYNCIQSQGGNSYGYSR